MSVILKKTNNNKTNTFNKLKEPLRAEIGKELEFVASENDATILKADPKFDFNKELEKATKRYNEPLKELVGR
ncbi:AbrB/MazE/SpoVT family DNA-binding domain-containing protein [Streptococcus fryi]